MTDHHDFGDHHFDEDYPPPDYHHDDQPQFEEPEHFDHFDDFGHELHTEVPDEIAHHVPTTEDVHVVDDQVHHDTAPGDDPAPADVFPPPVDVGDLPEPVDGFPWTDAATLGSPDLGNADLGGHDATLPVDPHELAEYAGTEIPPGADPWTVLADSDDPATSALARFWHDPAS
ncbi:hypothetical protein [Actinoplanes sp. NPDC051411]|uniref:hypothetical protein n=1 Tax=Actinoplanes sp. NPDC051411 TaxID=3155522 RepID=UPI00341EF20E